MGTVTQYNLDNVQAALGGANPISMSEYYRGGAYVPTTRTITVQTRDPSSGDYYSSAYLWRHDSSGYNPGSTAGSTLAFWNSATIVNTSSNVSSVTSGNTTTYRGSFRSFSYDGTYGISSNYFGVYRITTSTSTVSINTGVPSSGTISISQLYGAENP